MTNPKIVELEKEIAYIGDLIVKQTKELRIRLRDAQNSLDSVREQVVYEHLRMDNTFHGDANDITIGSWDCDNSPCGKCVYDPNSDLGYDSCVFCGEPDERK